MSTPADRRAAIHELFTALDLPQTLGILLDRSKQLIFKRYNDLPAELWEQFRSDFAAQYIEQFVVPIYEKNYTDDELTMLLAFYRQPQARRLTAKSNAIMAQSMDAAAHWGELLGRSAVLEWLEKQRSRSAQ